ncbi:MAG: hypothetical protein ACUVQH_01085 [Thermogutta sp.]
MKSSIGGKLKVDNLVTPMFWVSFFIGLAFLLPLFGSAAHAETNEPSIRLEVAVDPRLPPMTLHEWAKALTAAGVEGLRVRTAYPDDAAKVEQIGSEPLPTYHVLAIVNGQNELVVPGARFSIREIARFVEWLDELQRKGPPQSRPKQVAFGLNIVQFQQVRQDMSRPVEFSTKGRPRDELIEKLGASLANPIVFAPDARKRLGNTPFDEELRGLATGTALAYLLRYDGLAMVPQASISGVTYQITIGHAKLAAWPVGWAPEDSEAAAVPRLLESLSVNIQGVSVKEVLQSVSERLSLPYLIDHPALVRLGIELDKATVKIPQTKTTYSQIIKRSLFQGRLKGEVRCDDAGKPFLWITTLKPIEEM